MEDESLRHRLLHESKTASKLTHPNIVTVYEVLEAEGFPVIVMGLVDGTSLGKRLDRDGPLPLEEILRHAEDLADALAHAHGKNVLHRDVNPNNILIGRDGRTFLADFGLAKPIRSQDGNSQVSTTILSAPSSTRCAPVPAPSSRVKGI